MYCVENVEVNGGSASLRTCHRISYLYHGVVRRILGSVLHSSFTLSKLLFKRLVVRMMLLLGICAMAENMLLTGT